MINILERKNVGNVIRGGLQIFQTSRREMIRKAGGPHKWNRYSDIKKAERKAAMIEEAVTELISLMRKKVSSSFLPGLDVVATRTLTLLREGI